MIAALLAPAFALGSSVGIAQLLPAGEFVARDGRPGPGKCWRISDAQGKQLAAKLNATASQTPIVIDYEHQTLLSKDNGREAPAAGWIRGAQWRPGQGLFATVEWTAHAKARIAAGEYRYISPVITYDDDGNVTGLQLAALVNHPALIGMEPVLAELAARLREQQESSLNESLNANDIAQRARAYQAAQLKAGLYVSTAQAVEAMAGGAHDQRTREGATALKAERYAQRQGAKDLAGLAMTYYEAQLKAGFNITIVQAVNHVAALG